MLNLIQFKYEIPGFTPEANEIPGFIPEANEITGFLPDPNENTGFTPDVHGRMSNTGMPPENSHDPASQNSRRPKRRAALKNRFQSLNDDFIYY